MSKNLAETVCLHPEKREESIRELRKERLQGIAWGTRSALRLANSPAEKETSIPLQKDSDSQSKKQSYLNELSKNSRKGDVR